MSEFSGEHNPIQPTKEEEFLHTPFMKRIKLAREELKAKRPADALREIAGIQGQWLEDEYDKAAALREKMRDQGDAFRDETREKYNQLEARVTELYDLRMRRTAKIRGYVGPAEELFDK